MNKYPLWKYLLILAVIIPGFLYALPNLYGEDPALQISATRTAVIDEGTEQQIKSALTDKKISFYGLVRQESGIQLRFKNTDDQLKAKEVVEKELGDKYTVALNLVPATPAWMAIFDAKPMYLGLDLRGGVHFLMEVDIDGAISNTEKRLVSDLRSGMRENKIRYLSVASLKTGGIQVLFPDQERLTQGLNTIKDDFTSLSAKEVERDGKPALILHLTEKAKREIRDTSVKQNMTALRNRINELGVAEPIVQQQGDNRIVVQLPGIQDTARAKEIIGRTATLEIMMVDEKNSGNIQAALEGRVPVGSRLYRDRHNAPILIKKGIIYSGNNIIDASAGIDSRNGGAVVNITLDARGASINQRITGENIGKRMAVVYVEQKSSIKKDEQGNVVVDKSGRPVRVRSRIEEVITAPVIRDQLGKRFQIEGLDSSKEARDLALLLRAGALAAPIEIVEERTIGPSLGKENIRTGFLSVAYGLVAILIFMLFYYRIFGLVADIALVLNLILMVAVLSLFQATLTLPGVAGILLTIGMAVDANVLIFERIREELRNGVTPQAAIHAGYDKALSTIVDANVTTLIAAVVLFNFGTGPIKGFAITLSIGIVTSMFTAIMVSRGIINKIYGGRQVKKLAI
ncbi:preprotein translocase subunit SecD [bacterium BMS3Bbin11]|nr:preprotein translocase subunit SecD [bacterium BMS3Abin11]GBE45475.1 preprotein translocase subunit SecD [bacterium BMS3Bbin11]HDH15679.1 protein translocase subunit SecD [Gammaproteobacteria bacterium]HDZ78308.1 protein translocase subunit SecD [Gammaproteobacteria bacterium]